MKNERSERTNERKKKKLKYNEPSENVKPAGTYIQVSVYVYMWECRTPLIYISRERKISIFRVRSMSCICQQIQSLCRKSTHSQANGIILYDSARHLMRMWCAKWNRIWVRLYKMKYWWRPAFVSSFTLYVEMTNRPTNPAEPPYERPIDDEFDWNTHSLYIYLPIARSFIFFSHTFFLTFKCSFLFLWYNSITFRLLLIFPYSNC